ncbi:MAG: S41 family peptidase [Spirochaetes bacterium]|nr:S41 family peptidase [Spirochaetota bacterium]
MLKRIRELKLHLVIVTFLTGTFFGINISGLSRAEEPIHKYLDYFHRVYQTVKLNFVDVPDNKEIFYGAIKGMIASLNDPYSRFLDEEAFITLKEETTGKFVGIGIEITIKDGEIVVISPIEDTPAMKEGILSGDVIIKVDDVVTKDKNLSEIIKLIKGLPNTDVKLTIRRTGYDEPMDFTIKRVPIKIKTVDYGILKEYNNIGYLKVKVFSAETAKDIENSLNFFNKNAIKKVIVDLRWNPGGLLDKAISITDFFLAKDKIIVSTRGREGTGDVSEFKALMAPLYNGELVVLVNNGSASASEIFSGAIKDNNRGKLIGTRTFGKGSVQKFFNVNENIGVTLTIARYYTPSGVSIHGKGIVPDFVVKQPQISKQDSERIRLITKRDILGSFVKSNKKYDEETRDKFKALLSKEGLDLMDRTADYILKKEIFRYKNSPLYDLEFDNQLTEAIKIINSMPSVKG